jgi:hypothetical protein
VWAGLAIASVFVAAFERWRRTQSDGLGLEGVVLAASTSLALIGITATLLATFDAFGSLAMTVAGTGLAAALWPWGHVRPTSLAHAHGTSKRAVLALLTPALLVGGALALRLPVNEYSLAGRDQGTYTLRARETLRTGSFEHHDPVLAKAGEDASVDADSARPGPHDILGLYPERSEPWRSGLYEGSYRPGWYLADRQGGRVVPQFFHLHPMLLATTGLVFGRDRMPWVIPLQAILTVLAMWCIARRLWPAGPWATVATGLFAATPVVVWVHRTTLSEVGAGLLVASAVLALLRAAAGEHHRLQTAALLLGSLAWLRGNGWLWAPAVLLVVWLVPGEALHRRRAAIVYIALVWFGVLVHASTVFPYVFDELRRQLTFIHQPTPTRLLVGVTLLLTTWICVDALAFGRHGAATHAPQHTLQLARLRRVAPRILVFVLGLSVLGYLASQAPSPPYSRLDASAPLVGLPLLGLAAIGTTILVWRWRPTSAADIWLVAVMAAVTLTVALYAQRNLPQLGLYYYGRYLVPEIVPAATLLGVATLRCAHAFIARRWSARGAIATTCVVTGALGWSVAGVLVTHPTTRLQEFAGADRLIEWIAQRVPEDAVIIAGGEGWHHGHTFNQVGGAIAMGHGRTVLPYRTREAAYATAWELLVARPRATGEPSPPVFLLINEATHRLGDEDGVRAAMDDLLGAPLMARHIDLLELVVHRLTPVTDSTPTRVTQDDLRMGLVELGIDPASRDEIASWSFDGWRPGHAPAGPPGLEVQAPDVKVRTNARGICLHPKTDLELRLPDLGPGPRSVVLVAAPGTATFNHGWRIIVDDEVRESSMTAAHRRARDTLGPLPLERSPRRIRIRGSAKKARGAACPHGALLELRVLPAERAWLSRATTRAITFAPPRDLGHPVVPAAWVSGRGLSRYRAGFAPETEVEAVSLVLTPDAPLRFMPEPLPAQGEALLDLVVTLTATELDPAARLIVISDGRELDRIDPPDAREGSWQSKPIRFEPSGAVARFELRLDSPSPSDRVRVRDIGLFSRTPPVTGESL